MAAQHPNFTPNENIILFNEVDGVCPMPSCSEELMYEKKVTKQKSYDIAHIYPLNPSAEEIELLKNEERLNSDPNDLDNLICLCDTCHTKFDKPRTLQEYRDMVSLKKKLILKNKERANWNAKLNADIIDILDYISSNEEALDDSVESEYDPKTIDTKTNDTITKLTKRKIKNNVEEYYQDIKSKFKELDAVKPLTTEVISSQIKTYFLQTSQLYQNQNDIFNAMVDWLFNKTNKTSREGCEVIISYFIQSCEIF